MVKTNHKLCNLPNLALPPLLVDISNKTPFTRTTLIQPNLQPKINNI